MNNSQPKLEKLSIIIHSGYYDKIHYALVMAVLKRPPCVTSGGH